MMEAATLIISIVSAIVATLSAIFALVTHITTVNHDRKQATLEAYNRLQNEVLDELNHKTKSEINEIAKNVKTDDYKHMSKHLARIEHFCVGVNAGIYDIKIVQRIAGKYFIGIYEKCLPLITKKREINKTSKHYDEFETTIMNLKKLYR